MNDERSPGAPNQSPLSTMPALLAAGKDLVALFRDGIIVAVALLLLMAPKTVNNRLVDAGFQSANIMGMEWKSGLETSNETLAEAHNSITALQEKNTQLAAKLLALSQTTPDHGVKDQIAKMVADTSDVKTTSQKVNDKVTQTIVANARMVSSDPKTAPTSQTSTSPAQPRPRSDYLVGLQTLGLSDTERLALNQRIHDAGYGLNDLSASYDTRPTWFAPSSTVFYYAPAALPAAQGLAALLKDLTGQEFRVAIGAGLGVDPSQKDVTLFVHYLKHP